MKVVSLSIVLQTFWLLFSVSCEDGGLRYMMHRFVQVITTLV